jgi:hypothetical protein
VPVVVAFVFSGAVFLQARRRQAAKPWYRRIAEDLESSFAKVTTCLVPDAINMEEPASEQGDFGGAHAQQRDSAGFHEQR